MKMKCDDAKKLTGEVVRILGRMKSHLGQAHSHMKQFANSSKRLREFLHAIDEHKGWEALGYADLVEYAQAEYGFEVKDIEEQLKILKMEENLASINEVAGYLPGLSPVVTVGSLSSDHYDVLKHLSLEQQQEVFRIQAEKGDLSVKGLKAAAAAEVFKNMSLEEQKAFLEAREKELEKRRQREEERKANRSGGDRNKRVVEKIHKGIARLRKDAAKNGLSQEAIKGLELAEKGIRQYEECALPLFATGSEQTV